MSTMDLEKLKMMGAGRAMAVLTSGGDAQGDLKLTKTVVCGVQAPARVYGHSSRSHQRARDFYMCARACRG